MFFTPASKLKESTRIKTGILTLDEEWGGFLEGSSVVLSGPYGAGKTLFAYQLLFHALLAREGDAYIIDTEGTFSQKRMLNVFKGQSQIFGGDPESMAERVFVGQGSDLEELLGERGALRLLARGGSASAVVVDSLGFMRREEHTGLKGLNRRRKHMARFFQLLNQIKAGGALVVITNHVYGGPKGRKMYGGTYVEHLANYHIFIEKKEGQKRVLKTVDFPDYPEVAIPVYICPAGLVDAVEINEENEHLCNPFAREVRHPRSVLKL